VVLFPALENSIDESLQDKKRAAVSSGAFRIRKI